MIPPTIDLAGIRLRGLRPEDAVAWHTYLSDPLVIEFTSYPQMSLPAVQSMIERCRSGYDAGSSCKWAVATEADDQLVGTCGFNQLSRSQGWAELGYDLARSHWGRGLIAQAVGACLDWAFEEPDFNRVHAFVMVGNTRSERVLDRACFTREGCLRSYRMCRGNPRDYWVFSMLRREWEQTLRGRPTQT
ncbi:MAG: N-acetyltransferase [Acidobacteria bacterium]|nr:MAG: N-acetyltransferase [Acidobacteriota bacterium]